MTCCLIYLNIISLLIKKKRKKKKTSTGQHTLTLPFSSFFCGFLSYLKIVGRQEEISKPDIFPGLASRFFFRFGKYFVCDAMLLSRMLYER